MSNQELQNQFMFYSSQDGTTHIQVIVEDETVWASQSAMAEIFDTSKQNISKHLLSIFSDGELLEESVVNQKLTTATDGKNYTTKYYNLDVIISVGYRVNSYKATQFRVWATSVIKEYLIKGFAMDDERLKQGKVLFGKDHFEELIERIRDIRASERRFYQKVTDIFIDCSYDYDKNSPTATLFFSHAQNKLEYAVTGMVAAEIIKARVNHNLPHMGLTSWGNQKKGGKITKRDITVAKNYLTESEISDLNRLVNMFLDYAENLARKGKSLSMNDWHEKLNVFLEFNEYEVLQNYGNIKKETANNLALKEYKVFSPIQDNEHESDFDKAVKHIQSNGGLPKSGRAELKKMVSGFDKKLKTALNFNSKD